MSRVEELVAAGSAALRLPQVLRQHGCSALRDGLSSPAPFRAPQRLPVLLVHGYGGTDAVWTPLRRALADAGYDHVIRLVYNGFAAQVEELAGEVAEQARAALRATDAPAVHLVGHSLGGLIARYAVHGHDLWGLVSTAVTIATPHSGSPYARWALGACARRMLPGSPLMAYLCGPVPADRCSRSRWVSYYSDADRIVPPWSAQLRDPRLRPRNVLVPGRGHLTICRDPGLVASVVAQLGRGDEPPARALPAPSPFDRAFTALAA
jgi:triacylglycerol lipase